MFPTTSFEIMSFKSKKKKKNCIIPCFKTYNTMSVADIVLYNCCEFVLCLGYILAKFGVDWLRFGENRILLLHNANCLIFWHYHIFPYEGNVRSISRNLFCFQNMSIILILFMEEAGYFRPPMLRKWHFNLKNTKV